MINKKIIISILFIVIVGAVIVYHINSTITGNIITSGINVTINSFENGRIGLFNYSEEVLQYSKMYFVIEFINTGSTTYDRKTEIKIGGYDENLTVLYNYAGLTKTINPGERSVETILDYGCGKFLRDSIYLSNEGFVVDSVDISEQLDRMDLEDLLNQGVNSISSEILGKNYDVCLLNYVIQVVETESKRDKILDNVCDSIKPTGYLIISSRSKKEVNSTYKNKFEDGYITRLGTFIKGFNEEEVESLINERNLKTLITHKMGQGFLKIAQKKKI